MSSPTKSRGSASPHYVLEGGGGGGGSGIRDKDMESCSSSVTIQSDVTLRKHNMRRFSRSLDGLFQV